MPRMWRESVRRFARGGSRSRPQHFKMDRLSKARLIDLPRHARVDGEVVVAEAAAQVPFRIERLFTVAAPVGAKRGYHAHRRCSQFMMCVNGAVEVLCEDGKGKN